MKKRSNQNILPRIAAAVLVTGILAAALLQWAIGRQSYGDAFDNSLYHDGPFRGVKAMVVVPHPDDELGLSGAAIRLLTEGGAQVFVLYSTNGDYNDLAAVRIREAVTALGVLGVPEENVFFLGYGDQWQREYRHIYYASPDAPLVSHIGYTQTYGADGHPDYRTSVSGAPSVYTLANFERDLEDAITGVSPDVLFCVDLDFHVDHRALSLTFDRVMGRILAGLPEDADTPTVFKGFAYDTAWYAEDDFYRHNIKSTGAPYEDMRNDERYSTDAPPFAWEQRVRFPVSADTLAYTKRASILTKALAAHASQNGYAQAGGVINGDEVFWRRNTNSLLYRAQIGVSSGNAAYLNDFMLLDSPDIDEYHMTYENCVWIPASSDAERTVTVTFSAPVTLSAVSLYDNAALEDNILAGVLTFSDGSAVQTGPLDPTGAETRIAFAEKTDVTSFTFQITQTEGAAPGLAELEAFSGEETSALPPFVKLTERESGDFLYRYMAEPGDVIALDAYAWPETGAAVRIALADVQTEANAADMIRVENDTVTVSPNAEPGQYLLVGSLADDPGVYDRISIWVPTAWEKAVWRVTTAYEMLYNKTVRRGVGAIEARFLQWRYGKQAN